MKLLKNRDTLFCVALILIVTAVGARYVHPGFVFAQADINPSFKLANQLLGCMHAWNYTQSYFGQPSSCIAYAPALALHVVLEKVIGSPAASVAILFVPLAFAALATYGCARTLGASGAVSFAAGIAFTLNPYVQALIGLNPLAIIFDATFATICFLLVWTARVPSARPIGRIALVLAFVIPAGTLAIAPQLLVELACGILVWWLLCIAMSKNGNYVRWTMITTAWIAVASLWWFVPVLLSIASTENSRPLGATSTAWTYARASLGNLLRLNPIWLWQYPRYFPDAAAYDANPITFGSGLILAVCSSIALVRLKGSRLKLAAALTIAALLCLFFSKGPHEPLPSLSAGVLSLPILFVFQEPAGLISGAIFFLCMIAALLGASFQRVRDRDVYSGLLVVASTASAWLLVTGASTHTATPQAISMYTRVPDYWQRFSNWLETQPPGGLLALPADGDYQARYDFEYVGADTIPISATRRRVLVPAPPFGYLQTPQRTALYQEVEELISSGSPMSSGALRRLGIRYVVLRGDVRTERPTISDSVLRRALGIAPAATFNKLTVYDLGSTAAGIEDWNAWIASDAASSPKDALFASLLENDSLPRFISGPPFRSVLAESARSRAHAERQLTFGPWRSFRYHAIRSADVRTAIINALLPLPSEISPFVVARPQRGVISGRPMLAATSDAGVAFINPFDTELTAQLRIQCHACYPGRTIDGRIGRVRVTGTAREQDDSGTASLTFDRVRIRPGTADVNVAGPGVVRADDLFGTTQSRPVTVSSDSYIATSVPMLAHPVISLRAMRDTLSPHPSAGVYLQLSRGDQRFVCYDTAPNYYLVDVYRSTLQCFVRNGVDATIPALAQTVLTGIILAWSPGHPLEHQRVVATIHHSEDAAGVAPIDPRMSRHGLAWRTASALPDGTIFDLIVAGSTRRSLHVARAHASFTISPIVFDGSNVFGFTIPGTLATATRVTFACKDCQTDPPLRVFPPRVRWNISGTPLAGNTIGNGSILSDRVGPGTTVTSRGVPASLVIAGAPPRTAVPLGGCNEKDSSVHTFSTCSAEDNSVLVTTTQCHWSWIAIERMRALPHLCADGWRNAWTVNRAGDVHIVNVLDVIALALAMVSILTVATLCILTGVRFRSAS